MLRGWRYEEAEEVTEEGLVTGGLVLMRVAKEDDLERSLRGGDCGMQGSALPP